MEKKLAVIVDNKEEVTTEVVNTGMCSSACDVAMETCSSQSHDACGERVLSTSGEFVEVLRFTYFARETNHAGEIGQKKRFFMRLKFR